MWPSILHATTVWLNNNPFNTEMDKVTDMTNEDRLFLCIGRQGFQNKINPFLAT